MTRRVISRTRCSNCGLCCEETEMELSIRDINDLEKAGYHRKKFSVTGEDGITRLRNVEGWCFFYNQTEKRCQVYEVRPISCYTYPVVYSDNGEVVIDELCPMGHTISYQELKVKGRILIKLINTLDKERTSKIENYY